MIHIGVYKEYVGMYKIESKNIEFNICYTFTMNSAVFITGLIAAIVLLIVVCFYKNHIADLTQNLRKADDKSKDWEYSFNVLKSRSKSLHCRTCPKRTAPHYKKDCGEQGDHCCDEYGRRLCDCVTPTDPRGESGAGRL
jgi:hypothetical protein